MADAAQQEGGLPGGHEITADVRQLPGIGTTALGIENSYPPPPSDLGWVGNQVLAAPDAVEDPIYTDNPLLQLPNKYSTRYVVHATATVCNKTKTDLHIPVLNITVDVIRSSLERWVQIDGSPDNCPDPFTIVTPEFLKHHPSIRTAQLPKHYEALSEEEANELLDPYA
jgi:hypothetical protein